MSIPYTHSSQKPSRNLISLVILTHDGYLGSLNNLLTEVEKIRGLFDKVILVVDTSKTWEPNIYEDIVVVNRKFSNPQEGRNAGLALVESEWVAYLDGDNLPGCEYYHIANRLAGIAGESVAIIYPDVIRVNEDIRAEISFSQPAWDYWKSREVSMCDTSSIWRVSALRQAGGWFVHSGMLDDYTTALKITQLGWTGLKGEGMFSILRQHAERRSLQVKTIPDTLWMARKLAVVTLFAGREKCLRLLMNWYEKEEFSQDTDIIWYDDSGSEFFNNLLWTYAYALRDKVSSVKIIKTPVSLPKGTTDYFLIHEHVAWMYNQVFTNTNADVFITVEDDVIPPVGAARRILEPFGPFCKWAGISAIYPSRGNDKVMVASGCKQEWKDMPKIDGFPAMLCHVGMIAGGFTAWNTSVLKKALPLRTHCSPVLGWDGTLCREINRLGYSVGVDGRIVCQHLWK